MSAILKPLSDIADTVERTGAAVVAMESISGDERARYRLIVAETFDVLQQAIALPSNRLTKLLAVKEQGKFADGLEQLADLRGWAELERAASLCEPLRACGREMDGLFDKLKGRIATRDWKRLRELVDRLLCGETEFAYLIADSLRRLSERAAAARTSPDAEQTARRAVLRARNNLHDLRRRLIAKQVEFYDVI